MKLHENVRSDIFKSALEQVPTRNGYGEGLKEAGEQDARIVALAADLTESTRTHLFAEAFPERFVQVGIAEQNMASVASGMAAMGKVPFIASYAVFSPGRNWEQVRTTIAYNNANVKIIGAHAGISVGPDGATHQAIEDIAIMRVMPNMSVLAPADVHEARQATRSVAEHDGPVYLRVAREKTPVIFTTDYEFTYGKAVPLATRDSAHETTVGLITTGTLAFNTLAAAKQLHEQGIGASVLHVPTIKPLDEAAILQFAGDHQLVVTIEEHQRVGGLGGAVAELTAREAPTRVVRLGVDDQFGQSGTPDELMAHFGLDTESIVAATVKAVG
jgi:transketolase